MKIPVLKLNDTFTVLDFNKDNTVFDILCFHHNNILIKQDNTIEISLDFNENHANILKKYINDISANVLLKSEIIFNVDITNLEDLTKDKSRKDARFINKFYFYDCLIESLSIFEENMICIIRYELCYKHPIQLNTIKLTNKKKSSKINNKERIKELKLLIINNERQTRMYIKEQNYAACAIQRDNYLIFKKELEELKNNENMENDIMKADLNKYKQLIERIDELSNSEYLWSADDMQSSLESIQELIKQVKK